MPPRPSRNLDRALLVAGRELFPARGCAGLTVREVADAAGVNLGMFHYHFKSREAFLRALLQSVYEDLFAELSSRASQMPDRGKDARAIDFLRAALQFMGRFVRANRPLLTRVLIDALGKDPIATEFLDRNMPRHLGLIRGLVQAAQAEGTVRADIPAPNLLGFCAGSLAMPILFGGAVLERGEVSAEVARLIEGTLLTDAALDQRIELALGAISNPRPQPQPAARKARARSPKARP
jgi:AcrR family transcriptional regulator